MSTSTSSLSKVQCRIADSQRRPPVDLRPALAPALNQEARPLCVPLTVTALHETLRAQAGRVRRSRSLPNHSGVTACPPARPGWQGHWCRLPPPPPPPIAVSRR